MPDVGAGLVPAHGRPQGAPLQIDPIGGTIAGTPRYSLEHTPEATVAVAAICDRRIGKHVEHSSTLQPGAGSREGADSGSVGGSEAGSVGARHGVPLPAQKPARCQATSVGGDIW